MSEKNDWTGERLTTDIKSRISLEHIHRYALASELVFDKVVFVVIILAMNTTQD